MFPVRTDLTCLTKPVFREHRSFKNFLQLVRCWADVSTSFQGVPISLSSASADILQLFLSLPGFLFPCGFPVKACLVVLWGGCLREMLNAAQCLHLICVSTGYCLLFIILFMKVWSVLLLPHKIKLIIHLSWKCRVYFLWRCILNSILVLDDLAVPILVYICLSLPPSFPTMLPSYVSTS